eukprot:5955222-Prymnesium_polylepis.1
MELFWRALARAVHCRPHTAMLGPARGRGALRLGKAGPFTHEYEYSPHRPLFWKIRLFDSRALSHRSPHGRGRTATAVSGVNEKQRKK